MNSLPPRTSDRTSSFAYVVTLLSVAAVVAIVLNVPPPSQSFPPLPHFSAYEQPEDMKAAFIDYLTPIVDYENAQILKDRARLERITGELMTGRMVTWFNMGWLKRLAGEYGVAWQKNDMSAVTAELLRRVDVIPLSLVIVQAAKESRWGQSRFAVEGNNLFGHWCYDQDCGIEPEQRPDGATHLVRSFDSVNAAVRSYLHNLNTHDAYEKLREIRLGLRLDHQPVTGMALADGLLLYSERREDYVEEVKTMIRQYHGFKNARGE